EEPVRPAAVGAPDEPTDDDLCVITNNGSVLHRYACDFGDECPAPGRSQDPFTSEALDQVKNYANTGTPASRAAARRVAYQFHVLLAEVERLRAAAPASEDDEQWVHVADWDFDRDVYYSI